MREDDVIPNETWDEIWHNVIMQWVSCHLLILSVVSRHLIPSPISFHILSNKRQNAILLSFQNDCDPLEPL